jgi:hypothetical protein
LQRRYHRIYRFVKQVQSKAASRKEAYLYTVIEEFVKGIRVDPGN